MMTDRHIRPQNDTNREVMIYRTPHVYAGEGCATPLTPEQVKLFAHRVRMLAHLGQHSFYTAAYGAGLRGAALRQVLDLLGAE
jgi:hypothetical protein